MINLNKIRWQLKLLGWFKIPMIGYSRPKLIRMTEELAEIEIPFGRRTKNHVNSAYIAVFTIGADLCCGLLAFEKVESQQLKSSIVFKSFKAEYLKRATSAVRFICEEGILIDEIISKARETKERQNQVIPILAYSEDELVARMEIELSIKIID